MLLPALTKAKQKAQMIQCLSNLHQIGLGLKLYLDDNHQTLPPGDSLQFNPNASTNWVLGNALGGTDPQPAWVPPYPLAADRLLARYTPVREVWHCPADRGMDGLPDGPIKPTSYQVAGNSYRFNWDLQDNYRGLQVAEDPNYNLAGKKESWAPEPSRFIMMHEIASYPWDVGYGTAYIGQWHYSTHPGQMFNPTALARDTDKFLAPVLFVDGHSQSCDFTTVFRANPLKALEPGRDWIWYKPLK